MSITKRQNETIEGYHKLAYDFLKKIKTIKECDIHDDFYSLTGISEQEIYRNATAYYNKYFSNEKGLVLFRDEIKDILDKGFYNTECPYCKKIMES